MIPGWLALALMLVFAVLFNAVINWSIRRSDARADALRDCNDEMCRMTGRFQQIERSEEYGVDVETRARMHADLMREKDEMYARHQRQFPELKEAEK